MSDSKKSEKGKTLVPSDRFVLTLPVSTEEKCPEFNYMQLFKAAEKKRLKERGKDKSTGSNGLDRFDDENDDKLREIAKQFEAKYGTVTAGKKTQSRRDDYIDLGAGYDENDSFIDNTSAYDELVPGEMTTALGGFYINSGPLEFKNNENGHDDNEESSEEGSSEDEEKPKRTSKRSISSSENEDTDGVTRV